MLNFKDQNDKADNVLKIKKIDEEMLATLKLSDSISYLTKIINYNAEIRRKMLNELKVINSISSNSSTMIEKVNNEIKDNKDINSFSQTKRENVSNDILKYIYVLESMELANFDDEDIYDAISEILPSRDRYGFKNTINRILLELEKIKKEYNDVIMESSLEDQNVWRLEYQKIIQIQNAIIQYRDQKIEDDFANVDHNQLNQIIFLKDNDGNMFLQKDLSGISTEYNMSFKKLIQSIVDGSYIYKNYRYYKNINKNLTGFIAVKGFKTRVIIQRLALNQFVILGVFIKKTDNNTKSMSTTAVINNRMSQFSKEKVLSDYCDEDLMKIMDILDQKGKKVKRK